MHLFLSKEKDVEKIEYVPPEEATGDGDRVPQSINFSPLCTIL